ncbi:MAG: hypothetical protein R3B69_02025 [Candidatus Paceibacterota bacterium]
MPKIAAALNVTIDWKTDKGIAEADFSQVIASLPQPTAYQKTEKSVDVVYQPFSSTRTSVVILPCG